jgi:hypothetical protein
MVKKEKSRNKILKALKTVAKGAVVKLTALVILIAPAV